MQTSESLLIRIGSRKSRLALFQTELIKNKLQEAGYAIEIITFDTKGDLVLDKALHKVGDKGLFTKELEDALREKKIDLAVHSLKDMPTEQPFELPILAITERENPFDAVIFSSRYSGINLKSLSELPAGSVIGTSSLRRIAQLEEAFPKLKFFPLRGNIETRIDKIKNNSVDAGILAVAGLKRLGLENKISVILDEDICIPAPAQGALAVQTHIELDENIKLKLRLLLNHSETEILTNIERDLLRDVGGGCQTPFGAYARRINSNTIKIKTFMKKEGESSVRSCFERNIKL